MSSAYFQPTNKVWRACLLIIIGASLLYSIRIWRNGVEKDETDPWRIHPGQETNEVCDAYQDIGDIAVSVKTGATEAPKKLPAILSTSLRCVEDVMVFSDLEQNLDGLKIHDVLSRVSPSVIENNAAFELYRKQKELVSLHREGEIEALANKPAPARDDWGKGKTAAWALDKYKFLPMLEMAYALQPDRDWYVFIEADTYLSWPNLKRWLKTLDSTRMLFMGMAIRKSDDREPFYFAHGGAGYVLSGAAAKEFASKGVASRWVERTKDWWAGDMTMADALYDELGVRVTQVGPMFNQLDPKSIRFNGDAWCQPAITLHHMTSQDFDEIFARERAQSFSQLLLRDVYAAAYPHGLPSRKGDWDNISDAREFALKVASMDIIPHSDFDSCQIACEQNPKCFQFFFRNTTIQRADHADGVETAHECLLSSAFRLGFSKPSQSFDNEHEPGVARSWTSGWRTHKISKWVEEHWECPSGDHWVSWWPTLRASL